MLWRLEIKPITTISVKTQFAGMEVHKAVIKFLRHLRARYFSTFNLIDEGGYWESNDEIVLQKQFDRYHCLMNKMADVFRNIEKVEGETAGDLANRLARRLRERWKDLREGGRRTGLSFSVKRSK